VTTTGTSTIYGHMFRSFGLRENPFHFSPDPRFLFSGPAYETAVAELMFGIESHRGLLVLTGEAGMGKTTLVRHFLQWLKDRRFSSCYVFHSHLQSSDMLEFILHDFGVPVDSSRKSDLLATLHEWLHARQLEGDSPVIVIDEAQGLSLRALHELNLLLNLETTEGKLVQIVLSGQPELDEKLRRPELRGLRQRIMVRCRLPLLSLEETTEYIASRLRIAGGNGTQTFPPETVQAVYAYAHGIPRVINLLCEQALIGAYADRHAVVSPGNVRRVASEFDLGAMPISTSEFELFFPPPLPSPDLPVEAPTVPAPPVIQEPPVAHEAAADAVGEETLTYPELPQASEIPAVAGAVAPAEAPPPDVRAFAAGVGFAGQSYVRPTQVPPTEALMGAAALLLPTPAEPVIAAKPATKPFVPAAPASSVPKTQPVAHASGNAQGAPGWRKHRAQSPFRLYWRDVADSFVRDWSGFFASLAPHAHAFAGSVPLRADSFRRKVIEPLVNWLRTPVNPRRRPQARR
jgi:general secretion pathway protein A